MLDIKYSKFSPRYFLLYDKKQVFLIDSKYTNQIFNRQKKPDEVILNAYLVKDRLLRVFELDQSKKPSTLNTVLITQPFVTLFYNLAKRLFHGFNEEYSSVIKLLLLFFALIITILACEFYLKSKEKQIKKYFDINDTPLHLKVYKPKSDNTKAEALNWKTFLALAGSLFILVLPFYFYFTENDGPENIMLMMISFVFFFIYCGRKLSPLASPLYKNYNFFIEKTI